MRYVLEGEWTGYSSSQRRIVHRWVISEKRAKNFKLRSIVFRDNTSLIISVRPATFREKVDILNSYGDLIWDAEQTGKSRVTVLELNS